MLLHSKLFSIAALSNEQKPIVYESEIVISVNFTKKHGSMMTKTVLLCFLVGFVHDGARNVCEVETCGSLATISH